MFKKIKSLLLVTLVVGGTVVGCSKSTDKAEEQDKPKVTLVLSTGGVNDQSFNQSAWEGLKATEKELTDLPGLSIIQAKNIIRYREKHNGFGSLDEFFEEMNINSHLQQQLRNYLYVDSYLPDYGRKIKESTTEEYNITHKDNQNENNERIIDI